MRQRFTDRSPSPAVSRNEPSALHARSATSASSPWKSVTGVQEPVRHTLTTLLNNASRNWLSPLNPQPSISGNGRSITVGAASTVVSHTYTAPVIVAAASHRPFRLMAQSITQPAPVR